MSRIIHLANIDQEPRADSTQIAERLGINHRATIQLVRRYLPKFMELGRVPFEMRPFATRGGQQTREVAMLNEDQCYFLLSLSRNTDQVVKLKVSLVQAFGEARRTGIAKSLTAWQQLQALQIEDAGSFARASVGSRLMLERKHDLPRYRARRELLEREVAPQLFQLTH